MDMIRSRLTGSFAAVFPPLPPEEIPGASQSTVAAWDSIAAINLVNVIEEEFAIQLDLEAASDLDSFERISEYLAAECAV